MPHFKDPLNKVHFLEDVAFLHLLPLGSVEITDVEAHELQLSITSNKEMIESYTVQIQRRLDTFARTRNYDGILSACTYATSLIPKFKAEGQYAVEARDNTWAAAYELLAEVEAGTRPMPTLDEVIAALPELVWPQ